MESAMTRIDDKRRSGTTSGNQKNSEWSGCKHIKYAGSNESTKMKKLRGWSKIGTETGISAGGKSGKDDDMASTSNIIRTTTFFTVHSEEAGEDREE
jgi:hypothetical protein